MNKLDVLIALWLFFIAVSVSYADAPPPYAWALHAGGTGEDTGECTGVDGFGYVYVAGKFSDIGLFDGTELVSHGGSDIFIAKLNADGDYVWVKQVGSTGSEGAYDIYVTFRGYSYITGYFQGTAQFGDIELVSTGGLDIFIAKLDPNGNFLWAKHAGGTGNDNAAAISTDAQGNSYITGYFTETASFGATDLVSSGESDIFLAKLDPNGGFLWAKRAGGIAYDTGTGITVGRQGRVYISGCFYETAYFDDIALVSNGYYDIFIACLDPGNGFVWAKGAGAIDGDYFYDYGWDIAIDDSNHIYATGSFKGTIQFDAIELTAYGYENASDIFVAKLDANGVFQWAKQAGASGEDEGRSIFVSPNGDCYVTGQFQDAAQFDNIWLSYNYMDGYHMFVSKMDGNGNFLWAKGGYGYYLKSGYGVAVDAIGNTYISGYFYDMLILDDMELVSYGDKDILIAQVAYGTSQGPDASIVSQDITFTPTCPTPGDTIDISARVRNVGTADVTSGTASFYYSVQPNVDLQLIGSAAFGPIPPSGYHDVPISWHTDPELEQLDYVLTVELSAIAPDDAYAGNNTAYKDIPLPIELSCFTALGTAARVTIGWTTLSETDNLGFNLYRLTAGKTHPYVADTPVKLNGELIQGQGTSATPHSYSFSDQVKHLGKYIYILESVSTTGETESYRTRLQWLL